ncbi:hypothetical protein SAMN05446927_5418 [Caballeronia arationis]|uniref:Uncharacterized protein n=1 Tax=Caballeronia arationis TaxID=1777142 RepID=A0A7Z7N4L7_9BURK|nr:hypothetical protein SAMN05446927_5418 [Caballeronia arationis]
MNGYLLVVLIWAAACGSVCAFVHGAKKAKRSMDAVIEAKSRIKWPIAH